MKKSTKYLIGAGVAAVALGVGIYAVKSSSGSKDGMALQLTHGHRYTLTVAITNQNVDPSKIAALNAASVQTEVDSALGAGVYKVIDAKAAVVGQQIMTVIVFDVIGATAPTPQLNDQQKQAFASIGGKVSLVDNGKSPAGIAGVAGLGAPVYPMKLAYGIHAHFAA